MPTKQPPEKELQTLLRAHLSGHGSDSSNLALAVPTLEEVRLAIAAGRTAELSIRVVKGVRFKNVIPGKNRATVQSEMEFETLTLTRIADLKLRNGGAYSFTGEIRSYEHEEFVSHNGNMVRGYSQEIFRVFHDPNLNVPSTYKSVSFGQGTEFEGEED